MITVRPVSSLDQDGEDAGAALNPATASGAWSCQCLQKPARRNANNVSVGERCQRWCWCSSDVPQHCIVCDAVVRCIGPTIAQKPTLPLLEGGSCSSCGAEVMATVMVACKVLMSHWRCAAWDHHETTTHGLVALSDQGEVAGVAPTPGVGWLAASIAASRTMSSCGEGAGASVALGFGEVAGRPDECGVARTGRDRGAVGASAVPRGPRAVAGLESTTVAKALIFAAWHGFAGCSEPGGISAVGSQDSRRAVALRAHADGGLVVAGADAATGSEPDAIRGLERWLAVSGLLAVGGLGADAAAGSEPGAIRGVERWPAVSGLLADTGAGEGWALPNACDAARH
eukprot:NODE_13956_length_1137_cov_2.918812.p1 GENE.NODE_13956_length_1137_cov_2.918812~~NODE_13956_length_1137_cov_2.918812.p1  ORF type:complete len:343 (+),score=30.43 NODE_13956_length_1137_cov_2.918812:92-1120(+)